MPGTALAGARGAGSVGALRCRGNLRQGTPACHTEAAGGAGGRLPGGGRRLTLAGEGPGQLCERGLAPPFCSGRKDPIRRDSAHCIAE
eukprot:13657022-Alexandrium_andersonii.AAC.1